MNQGNNTVFYLFQCLFTNFSSREKSIIYMSNLCPCVRHWSECVLLHLISHITPQSQVLPILQGRTLKLRQVKPLVPGYKSFAQDFMVIMWQNQNLGPGGSDFRAQSLFITRRFWGSRAEGKSLNWSLDHPRLCSLCSIATTASLYPTLKSLETACDHSKGHQQKTDQGSTSPTPPPPLQMMP